MGHVQVVFNVKLVEPGTHDQFHSTSGSLLYFPNDPFAVCLVVKHHPHPATEWFFARDLLRQGLTQLAGEGDIMLLPCAKGEETHVYLRSPEGEAELIVPSAQVETFLEATYLMVAEGDESFEYELDDEIAFVLGGEES